MYNHKKTVGISQRRAGMSLVQLIAVIAIIGILAAILIPVFSSVMARSDDLRCRSNLRQLSVALSIYVNDHDGRFIASYDPEDEDGGGRFGGTVPAWGPTWAEYFARFYFDGDKSILHCPARPSHWSNAAGYYVDYAYNHRLASGSESLAFKTIQRVTRPAEILAFVDSVRPNRTAAIGGIYSISSETNVHYRHDNGNIANVVYVDGHVAGVRNPGDLSVGDPRHPFHASVFRDL